MSSLRFRIAFSFAGEKRGFVEKVAEVLARCFDKEKILYDKYHEAEFARHDLGMHLPPLYRDESALVVAVFSKDYDVKRWTGWEWTGIHAQLTRQEGSKVLLSRFDQAYPRGLYENAGFIELEDKTPHEFAALILERLAVNEDKPTDHYTKEHAQHLTPPSIHSSEEEQRIRDFVEIVGNVLLEFKTSFVDSTAEFPLLDKVRSKREPYTRKYLEAIGHDLWILVGQKSTKADGWEMVYDFWMKLLAELRLRFPRFNTPNEWWKLRQDPKHYQFTEPDWTNFLKRLVGSSILDPLDPRTNANLQPYRKHLVGKFREINLSGFGGPVAQSEDNGKAELSSIYIDLDTTTGLDTKTDHDAKAKSGPVENKKHGWVEQRLSGFSTLTALQQMAVHPHLVLIGLPGSGKSTLLEFFSLCLAQCGIRQEPEWLEKLSNWPKEEIDLVPVFVELRHFAASLPKPLPEVDGGEQLLQYILTQLNKNVVLQKCHGAIIEVLTQGKAIVFLDGLDEVPNNDTLRRFVLQTVEGFSSHASFGDNRIVVTCRPRSYEEPAWQLKGFQKAELAALTMDKVELFIDRFYAEVKERDPTIADVIEDRKTTLKTAVRTDELRELATNPFMLTIMAWLHRRNALPRKRALILDKIVEQLLDKWEESKQEESKRRSGLHGDSAQTETLTNLISPYGVEINSIRRVLCRLAYLARAAGESRLIDQSQIHAVRISEEDLISALAELLSEESMTEDHRKRWALQVTQFIDKRTGLLVPEGKNSFTMPYKLEEFLAGEHLTNSDELEAVGQALKMDGPRYNFEEVVAELIGENGYWEEVVKWAGAFQAHVNKNNKNLTRDLALQLCSAKAGSVSEPTRLRRAVVAGEILLEVGLAEVINSHPKHGPECLKKVRNTLDAFMRDENLSPKQRAAAGAARGWLEALPAGVGLISNKRSPQMERLPDLEWIDIPAGPFRMADRESRTGGKQTPLATIPTPYSISCYPITVVQFQAFVDDGGYEREELWSWSPCASQWLKEMKKPSTSSKPGPENYDPVFQTPNHPRVGVSWYEAVSFCKWLNEKLKLPPDSIRLPTEQQWVRVVRGPEGREGRNFPSESRSTLMDLGQQCNLDHSKIGHTSAVNLFPTGATPLESGNELGVADLAGNVWEWCLSPWHDNPPAGAERSTDDEFQGGGHRVARGGSWSFGHDKQLIDPLRRGFRPELRANDIGFRLVCVGTATAKRSATGSQKVRAQT